MIEEALSILKSLNYKNQNDVEWVKYYGSVYEYWTSLYIISSGELVFCPDSNLRKLIYIDSIEELFQTNWRIRKDWREFQLKRLLED